MNDNTEKTVSDDICWGRNPVFSLLDESPERCTKVLVSKNTQSHIKAKIVELCRESNIIFQNVDSLVLNRLTNKANHQGLVAYIAPMKLWEIEDLLQIIPKAPAPAMILLCDHIQDPHNLGALIRSAEAAGASAVMIPKRGGCLPTGTVVKTSAGAALRMPIAKVGNVSQTIRILQEEGFWVIGLSMQGTETLFKADMLSRTVFVIGAEGEGLGTATAKACDDLRVIPIKGTVGSLNASVAASLAMFEWTRS